MRLIEYNTLQVNLTRELLEEILNRDALHRGAIDEGEVLKISETDFNENKQELQVTFDLYKEALH